MLIKYLLLIELLQLVCSVNFTNIKFGLLIDSLDGNKKRDFIGNQALAAFLMAVKELNNKSDGLYDDLLPYTNISIAVATEKKYDDYSHQKIYQPLALTKSFNNAGIDALVGAARDKETKYAAYLYNDYDILTASYGASTSELSWANIYNYVIRTIPSISYEGKAMADIVFNYYGWKVFSVLYSEEGTFDDTAHEFVTTLIKNGVLEHDIQLLHSPVGATDYNKVISEMLYFGSNIFVLYMDAEDAANFILQASKTGVFEKGCQIIGDEKMTRLELMKNFTDETGNSSLLKGYLGVKIDLEVDRSSTLYKNFTDRWRSQNRTNGNNYDQCDNSTDDDGHFLYKDNLDEAKTQYVCMGFNFSQEFYPNGSNIDLTALYAYDATIALARGFHYGLYDVNMSLHEIKQAHELKHIIIDHVKFESVTGVLSFSQADPGAHKFSEGDRLGGIKFNLINFQPGKGLVTVGRWNSEDGLKLCEEGLSSDCHGILYNTHDNSIPRDMRPDINVRMSDASKIVLYVLTAISGILMLLFFVFTLVNRKTKILKASQPVMMLFVLAGGFISTARIALGASDIDVTICDAREWTGSLAFGFVFISLCVKTWRVHRLVNTTSFKKVRITANDITLLNSVCIFLLICYLIAVSLGGKPMVYIHTQVEHYQATKTFDCYAENPQFIVALYILEAVILLIGARLCLATKDVPDAINESKYIALCMGIIIIICVLVFPIVYLFGLPPVTTSLLAALGFGIATPLSLSILFVPKILLVYETGGKLRKSANGSIAVSGDEKMDINDRIELALKNKDKSRTAEYIDDICPPLVRNALGNEAVSKLKPGKSSIDHNMKLCQDQIEKWRVVLMNIQRTADDSSGMVSSTSMSKLSSNFRESSHNRPESSFINESNILGQDGHFVPEHLVDDANKEILSDP